MDKEGVMEEKDLKIIDKNIILSQILFKQDHALKFMFF